MDKSALRALGHGRLKDWGHRRAVDLEALGWSGVSATERMRARAHGGGASTAPGELTVVEQHCDDRGRTLQTELAVLSLPRKQREAVRAKYAEQRTMSVWASEQGKSKSTVSEALTAGVTAVGKLLASWRVGAPASSVQNRFAGPRTLCHNSVTVL